MRLLQAVALNGLDDVNHVNRATGSAYHSSFSNFREAVEIPGLPTENWMATRFGESGGHTLWEQDDSPGFKFAEATMLMFVPFNTNLSSIDPGRDILRFEGGGQSTWVGIRQRTDGSFFGWWGNLGNFDDLDIEFQPGFVYSITFRVRGQSTPAASNASVELFINGELKWSRDNFQISTANGTTYEGTNELVTSGPGFELFYRDIVVWDEWTTDAGVAPAYYRAEMVTSQNMVEDASSTMTAPPLGVAALSDEDDDTFYLGDADGEFLQIGITEPSHSLGGPSTAQRITVESTKGSTENVIAELSVTGGVDTELHTWEDLSTDSPSYRYFTTSVDADDVSEITVRITSNELPPLP